jgi:phage gpG-like protein
MSVGIQVKISSEAEGLLLRLGNQPGLMRALEREMKVQMDGDDGVRQHIVQNHLRADPHPTDPSEHTLGVKTRLLSNSTNSETSVIDTTPTTVTAHIGSNVSYARIHEYGGIIKRVLLAGSVHLRADRKGNLLQGVSRFARKTDSSKGKAHKQFVNRPFAGGKRYEIVMPERAPFRTGIAEKLDDMGRGLSGAIIKYWGGESV